MNTKIIDPALKLLMDVAPLNINNVIQVGNIMPSIFSMDYLNNFYHRK